MSGRTLRFRHAEPSNKLALKARQAIDDLLLQARGIACLTDGWSPTKPTAAEARLAIVEYAILVCAHVEKLNSLIETRREDLLPVSRKRFTWPILKSAHPLLCQNEEIIIPMLEVGKGTGRYMDRFSKWKPDGKMAYLTDELLYWIAACKSPLGPVIYSPRGRELAMTTGIASLYTCDGAFCNHPLLALLRRHLMKRERIARELSPLAKDSVEAWVKFVGDLLNDCFKDEDCASHLIRSYVPVGSRTNQKSGHGRAKEFLIRKVCDRLKSFAGVKP